LSEIYFKLLDVKANSHQGEEFRAPNLERECNEEVCDWEEAYEIFGDKEQTDQFMYNRLHQCQIQHPCFQNGTQECANQWNNYWCDCGKGWYGKDSGVRNFEKFWTIISILIAKIVNLLLFAISCLLF